jgi:hypothetical protein
MRLLNRNPLDLVERNFIISPVIELGCPRRFVVRDLLRDLEFTAVFQIGVTPPFVRNCTLSREPEVTTAPELL